MINKFNGIFVAIPAHRPSPASSIITLTARSFRLTRLPFNDGIRGRKASFSPPQLHHSAHLTPSSNSPCNLRRHSSRSRSKRRQVSGQLFDRVTRCLRGRTILEKRICRNTFAEEWECESFWEVGGGSRWGRG